MKHPGLYVCIMYIQVLIETKEPTLKTRLTRRSESYGDLTQTLRQGLNVGEFEAIRGNLKDAVFEEWYFRNME